MARPTLRFLPITALLLAAAACTVGPDYHPPAIMAPKTWVGAKAGVPLVVDTDAERQLAQWWKLFKDPELDSLVDRAITQNLDVKSASLRVAEARAALAYVRAGFFPSVSAGVDASRQRLSTADKFPPFGGVYNTFQAGFDMSWELDVFGQTRREVEASTASIQGEEEKRRGTLVTLLGDLGSDYASLRATQARLRIAERNIAVGKQILDFTRERSDHGLASELDVAEADAQVHELQSVVPDFQAAIAQQEFAIAELLGQEPDALQDELRQDDLAPDSRLLAPLPRLPAEIPSEVIRNRPDVRAAERQLASATATIGIAESAYFPKFTIDPSLDLNAGWLHRMLDVGAMAWAVPASISMPVFDSGKISAEVSLAKTYAAAELIAYQKTVLTAFQEVETALSGYQAATAKATSLEGAADADQIALDRATDLYKNGLGDFITVLENEKSLYSAQDALTENRLALSLQTIALYKALGSGWQSLPDVPPAKPRQWP